MKRHLLSAFTIAMIPFALQGCLTDGGSGGVSSGLPSNSSGQIALGHYYYQSDGDIYYTYEQYLVFRTTQDVEFVEYGFDGNHSVCEVTRQRATYQIDSDSLRITVTQSGPSISGNDPSGCGITKVEFDAYPFTTMSISASAAIRNITASSFDAYNLMGSPIWESFSKVTDPTGFFTP